MFKRMDLLYFLVSASFIERIEWVTKVFSCIYIYISRVIYVPGSETCLIWKWIDLMLQEIEDSAKVKDFFRLLQLVSIKKC